MKVEMKTKKKQTNYLYLSLLKNCNFTERVNNGAFKRNVIFVTGTEN